MKKLMIALTAAALLTAPSLAAPCKDAKGKFTKCPPAAAAPAVIKCKDGTTSNAKTRKGACSRHGGIAS